MSSELDRSLLESRLLLGAEAANALVAGWQIETIGEPSVVNEVFVATYRLRAKHVRSKAGEHWQQLASATEELVQNLEPAIGAEVDCLTISGNGEHKFIVFRSTASAKILGCLRVIPVNRDVFNATNETAA